MSPERIEQMGNSHSAESLLQDGFAALIDFGSTFTKVALVDLEKAELVARHQSPTTVQEDIMLGLNTAIGMFSREEQKLLEGARKYACSSAAGGLRVVAIGLVPALTVEAAQRAALGAGAKIVASYGYELTDRDLEKITAEPCDLILLSGGIDGGNKDVILHNAEILARIDLDIPFIVAGNRVVSDRAAAALRAGGHFAMVTENILPTLDELNVEPARQLIRDVFMSRIVRAKGLDGAQDYVGGIIMPTPMATLEAGKLLANGSGEEAGQGELLIVEVGGATTNVHSLASGHPLQAGMTVKGLPEPFAKRTVEGDLGIRYNAHTILEKLGVAAVQRNISSPGVSLTTAEIREKIARLAGNVGFTPENNADYGLDAALARCAVSVAMERHAGTVKEVPTLQGSAYLLYGKDLTQVPVVIGAGGVFAYGKYPREILKASLFNQETPASLMPKNPAFYIDQHYILYGVGLLSNHAGPKALKIARKYLKAL